MSKVELYTYTNREKDGVILLVEACSSWLSL